MDAYLITLYGHFLALIGAVTAATIMHVNLYLLKQASTNAEARTILGRLARVAPLLPVFSIVLFASGAWLVQLRWSWSYGYVIAGVVGLVSMPLTAGIFVRPRMTALAQRLGPAKDGPLDAESVAAINNRAIGGVMMFNHTMALVVVFIMVAKPSVAMSLGLLLLAPVVGLWTAFSPQRSATPSSVSRA